MSDALIEKLMTNFGFAGLLVVAVYIIAKKLATQYEARISALEAASSRCETDRVALRDLIITTQAKHITALTDEK